VRRVQKPLRAVGARRVRRRGWWAGVDEGTVRRGVRRRRGEGALAESRAGVVPVVEGGDRGRAGTRGAAIEQTARARMRECVDAHVETVWGSGEVGGASAATQEMAMIAEILASLVDVQKGLGCAEGGPSFDLSTARGSLRECRLCALACGPAACSVCVRQARKVRASACAAAADEKERERVSERLRAVSASVRGVRARVCVHSG
jgi:hypothetical protein